MLYVIIAAVAVLLLLRKKADTGGGKGASGGGTGSTLLPAGTNIYKENDGQLILWGPLANPENVTSLQDATRPDCRYFERSMAPTVRQ